MQKNDVSRRSAIAASAAAAAGLAVRAGPAAASVPKSGAEAANLKLVEGFIQFWNVADFDPVKMAQDYLAADCHVRIMETLPFANGPAEAAEIFKKYMQKGERVDAQILSTYAQGPIVVTHRIDNIIVPGKQAQKFEMVGVFFVKAGKIKEWTDYVVTV